MKSLRSEEENGVGTQVAPWKRAIITRSMALVPCLLVALHFGNRKDGLDVLNGALATEKQALGTLKSIKNPLKLTEID